MLKNWLGGVYGEGETPEPAKTFTQEDVNKFLADDRRKHQTKVAELQKEVDTFKGAAEEKTKLQAKLEELNKTFLSKEELAKAELEKKQNEFQSQLDGATKESAKYKGLFENTLLKQAISSAAVSNKAYNAEQLQLLLLPQSKVIPVTDDNGNVVGYNAVAPVMVKDKVVELPINEAVAKLRENPTFANLFLVDAIGGIGRTINNTAGATGLNPNQPPSDPAAYREWRQKVLNKG
jgi:hypothetical protein